MKYFLPCLFMLASFACIGQNVMITSLSCNSLEAALYNLSFEESKMNLEIETQPGIWVKVQGDKISADYKVYTNLSEGNYRTTFVTNTSAKFYSNVITLDCNAKSNIVKALESFENSSLKLEKKIYELFPNPVSNNLNIQINASSEYGYMYSVSGIDGQRMQSGELVSGSNEIDLDELAQGIYFIQIKDSLNEIRSFKIVKL